MHKIGTSAVQVPRHRRRRERHLPLRAARAARGLQDAWDEILAPQLDYRHRPCNFVEILPRLGRTSATEMTRAPVQGTSSADGNGAPARYLTMGRARAAAPVSPRERMVMRFLRRSLTGLFLMALTLGLLVYAAVIVRDAVEARMARRAAHAAGARAGLLRSTPCRRSRDVAPVLTAFGEVQSRRDAGTARRARSGRMVELAPEMSTRAGGSRQGQLLARIDPADAAGRAATGRDSRSVRMPQAERRDAARALELAADDLAAAEDRPTCTSARSQRQRDLQDRGVGTDRRRRGRPSCSSPPRRAVLIRAARPLAEAEARVDSGRDRDRARARSRRDRGRAAARRHRDPRRVRRHAQRGVRRRGRARLRKRAGSPA